MSICLKKDHVLQDAELKLTCDSQADELCSKINWTVTNEGAESFQGTLRLAVELPDRLDQPWFMIPGVMYGSNTTGFGAGAAPKDERWPRFDPAVDQPARMVANAWDFAADRTGSPMVYMHAGSRCFALASYPHYSPSVCCTHEEYEP